MACDGEVNLQILEKVQDFTKFLKVMLENDIHHW